jgi:hypothetical protein
VLDLISTTASLSSVPIFPPLVPILFTTSLSHGSSWRHDREPPLSFTLRGRARSTAPLQPWARSDEGGHWRRAPCSPRPGDRRAHVQQQLICRPRRPGCDGVRVVAPHSQGHVQARELTGDACLCSPRPGARPGQEVPASTAP